MKKERLFYLDFVRAMATLLIVLTHYNAIFLYTNPQMPEKAVISLEVFKLYIGNLGVSLFLIISGAALFYVYENKMNIKTFYKKRFLNIYPMFWIGYVGYFLWRFYCNRGINPDIPRWKIIYSILGMDAYLTAFGDVNFYIVGEWFLGFIILFYLVYPFLQAWMKKSPVSLTIVSIILYIVCIVLQIPKYGISLPVLMPSLLFGMYFVKYIKMVNWKMALGSVIVLIVNQIFPWEIDKSIRSTYVGIAVFLIMVYLSEFIKWIPFKRICSYICKYSYAIFIIHHMITLDIVGKFDLYQLTRFHSYLLFLTCCCVIFPAAWFLQKVHDKIMQIFKKD